MILDIENHIFFFDDIKETNDVHFVNLDPHSFFRYSSFGYTFTANGDYFNWEEIDEDHRFNRRNELGIVS